MGHYLAICISNGIYFGVGGTECTLLSRKHAYPYSVHPVRSQTFDIYIVYYTFFQLDYLMVRSRVKLSPRQMLWRPPFWERGGPKFSFGILQRCNNVFILSAFPEETSKAAESSHCYIEVLGPPTP